MTRIADAIPVPTVLGRRLAALGIDTRALLRDAGLPASLLNVGLPASLLNARDTDKPRLTTAGFFALWRALERTNGDASLGLRLAAEVTPDQLDVSAMAAVHAADFGLALEKLARYKRLVCPEDIRIVRERGAVSVEFRWLLTQEATPPRLIDSCFASVLQLARHGTGTAMRPLRVEFARAEHDGDALLMARHFECPVHFGAASDRIVFAEEALRVPFRTSNPDVLAMLLPGLEAALPATASGEGAGTGAESFVADVRAEIHRQMQGRRPGVDGVAAALALSPRSLQRRLGERGTSYQQLLDDVRRQVARELLRGTALETGEIAFLLGFEELNSFNRAFSGWEGASPLQWRRQGRPGQPLQ